MGNMEIEIDAQSAGLPVLAGPRRRRIRPADVESSVT
jgi:hypothetical protein